MRFDLTSEIKKYIIKDMKIVILGVGKVGETLVKRFVLEDHDVVVVDSNASVVTQVVNRYDVTGRIGEGLKRDVLMDAGVNDCDFFIAATSRDEVNLIACVLAKKLGAKFTIARVRDPEIFSEMDNMRKDLGLDVFFNPEYRTALEIVGDLKFPSARNVESFAGGRALMAEFQIQKGNSIIDRALKDIVKDMVGEVLFAAVIRDDGIVIPHGDFVIKEGDIVHVVASESQMFAFCKFLNVHWRRAKNVFIVGGGKISYYLAKELESQNVNVKILDKDKERAAALSASLTKTQVFVGDGSDQEVLDEEGLKVSDACVALTGMDELNVIISLYAKKMKINKVITKIDRASVLAMAEPLGLETVISPREFIANHILRYVRAHKGEAGSGINTLYQINDKAEALEFTVDDGFSGIGKAIKELKLKNNVLLCGIVRNNEFILPRGDKEIMANDKLIVITKARQISALEQILE